MAKWELNPRLFLEKVITAPTETRPDYQKILTLNIDFANFLGSTFPMNR